MNNTESSAPVTTREDMLRSLEEERLARERLVTEQVNVLLAQGRCTMEVDLTFGTEGRPKMRVRIVAEP